MNFLFWNVGGQPLDKHVCTLVAEHGVDVVVLAEAASACETERALSNTVKTYFHVTTDESRVKVFTSFSKGLTRVLEDGGYFSALEMVPPLLRRLLLVGVHFPSKLYQDPESQALECTVLADRIRKLEEQVGHRSTVVIGDLNMNPFESGVVGAAGLHAVAAAAVARRLSRTVAGRAYDFFYNPTWAHMSDRVGGPPGTYFRTSSEQVSLFWHALDQVLLRPALLDLFKMDGLRVLEVAGPETLVNPKGHPSASDHLPLLLTLAG